MLYVPDNPRLLWLWLNIHGTMVAGSHFLLGNKAPVDMGCRDNSLSAVIQILHHLCWFHSCQKMDSRLCSRKRIKEKLRVDKWVITSCIGCSVVEVSYSSRGEKNKKISWHVSVSTVDGKCTDMIMVEKVIKLSRTNDDDAAHDVV